MARKTNLEDDGRQPKNSPLAGAKPLSNFRHERFANFIVRGFGLSEAYEKLGYAPNPKNAYRLKKTPKIKERIDYLLEAASKKSILDASYIKDRLGRIVDLALVTEVNEYGQEVLGPTGNLAAATRALELLGREQGIFKDKIELGGQVSVGNRELFEKMSPAEKVAVRAALMAAAGRTSQPANDDSPQPEDQEAITRAIKDNAS